MAHEPESFLDAEGVWCQVLPDAHRGGPALFLDRDGFVVEEVEYLCRIEDIDILPGAAAVIAAANARAVPVILVTNQAGIGRGYYGWREFQAVQDAIIAALVSAGACIDAIYAAPHHPSGLPPYRHADHPARKPNPGMLLRAAADLALDLGGSWLVGDKAIDIAAARAAGLRGALHVLTGHGREEREAAKQMAAAGFSVLLGASIADAETLLPLFAEDSR